MKRLSMLSAEEVQSQAMGPGSVLLSTVHYSASVRAGALPFWPFLETRLLHLPHSPSLWKKHWTGRKDAWVLVQAS